MVGRAEAPMRATVPAEPAAPAASLPAWPLALVRIAIGILWFTQLLWKLPPDFGCGPKRDGGLCFWMAREVQHPAVPAYGHFVQSLVLPNVAVLGWVVWLVEAFITVSLILGLLSRLGGLVGLLQSLNLLIGLAAVPGEWYWTYVMLALFQFLFTLLAPGRVWGLDALLRPRALRGDSAAARFVRLAT